MTCTAPFCVSMWRAPDEVTDSLNDICDRIGEQEVAFVRTAARRILEKAEW